MGDEPKKVLTGIRTFAQDLEQQKGKTIPVSEKAAPAAPVPEPGPVVIAEKLKAPEVFKNPTPLNTAPPAFHELHKKPPQPTEPEIDHTPASFLKAPTIGEATFDEGLEAPKSEKKKSLSYTEATIITDTKKNKVDVVSSSASSLSAWWKEFLNKFKRKEPPKYTVADVERRKGVVQKATSKTATIFTADNETLREEIRRRRLATLDTQDKDGDSAELLWSPNTEPGFPLLPEAVAPKQPIENVTVTFKKRSVPPPVFVEPKVVRPVVPLPEIVVPPVQPQTPPESDSRWETEAPINTQTPTPLVTEAPWVSAQTPLPVPTPAAATPLPRDSEADFVQTVPPPAARTPKLVFHFGNFDRVNTNRLSLSIVGILGGALFAVFLAQAVMEIIAPDTTQTVINEPAVALISGSQIVDLPVSSLSETSIEAALAFIPPTQATVSEIRLIDQATGLVIPAQEILRYFNFAVNPNFNQSITTIHLTLINNERALLFKVTDATTVFGALLDWEPNMARDLASILQIQTPSSNERFTDGTLGQSDIRILSSNGTDTVVYGFIDKSTVLITKNQTAFTTAISR